MTRYGQKGSFLAPNFLLLLLFLIPPFLKTRQLLLCVLIHCLGCESAPSLIPSVKNQKKNRFDFIVLGLAICNQYLFFSFFFFLAKICKIVASEISYSNISFQILGTNKNIVSLFLVIPDGY